MKLHLPSALRGALLACFAVAGTAWAAAPVTNGNDILFSGSQNAVTIYPGNGDTYTLKPDSGEGVIASLRTLNVTADTTIKVDGGFQSLTLTNVMVADEVNLTIDIAPGTTLVLSNVNFTGEVNYNLGEGSWLVISADDLKADSVSGSGTIVYSRGTLNATKINDEWFQAGNYGPTGGVHDTDITKWSGLYLADGATTTFTLGTGVTVQINGPGATGGSVVNDAANGYMMTWRGEGGLTAVAPDEPSIIIDLDGVVRKSDAQGGLYWDINRGVTAEALKNGSMPDLASESLVALQDSDTLVFTGGALATNGDASLANTINVEGANLVKLAPAAGKTLTLSNGDGALSNPNGLELSGGAGSTVTLQNVATTAPSNIIFTTDDTTLAISGPGTLEMDAEKNTFLSTSHLRKDDGGTLSYLGKATDTIGSLTNSKGTLDIGRKTNLTAKTLSAGTLSVLKDGTTLNATTVEVGKLTIGASVNEIISVTAGTLKATGTVEVGSWSTLSATTMETAGMTVAADATLTAQSLKATGTASVTGLVKSGVISLTGKEGGTGTVKGMALTGTTLSATGVDGSSITVSAGKARAATTLTLGKVTNSVINTVSGTVIEGSTITGGSVINGVGSLTLSNTTHDATASIEVTGASASLTLDGATLLANAGITAGGSTYSTTAEAPAITLNGKATAGALTLTGVTIDMVGQLDEMNNVTFLTGSDGTALDTSNCTLSLLTEPGMVGVLSVEGNKLVFSMRDESEALIDELKTSPNVTGAVEALAQGAQAGTGGVIKELYNYLRDTTRASLESRQAALESLASGSLTMLADSQRVGVGNTINRLRNRVIQMGNPQGIEPQTKLHAWIEADTSFNDIDQDGSYAGYEFQTYGGTVGAHMDMGNFSFGAAISAAYGELTSHSSDQAEADHNTVSLSAFARHQYGNWTQMAILSVGRNEIEMDRTISTPRTVGESKTYNANGDASGHTITAYYEAGYSIALNEASTHVLQPLMSVMLTSARMGDFTETGSIGNAGICADTEDYFYGTVGLGLRYQVVLAENVYERVSFLELRARAVQDFGDETNELSVNYAGLSGQSFTVKGADVGRTGFQFGAGLSMPIGGYTTFFADVDADIRSGATSVGGSVGLRFEF